MEFTIFQSALSASRPRRLKARDRNTIWQNKSTTTSISSCFDRLPRSSLADAELRFQSRINFFFHLLRQHGQDVKRLYNQCIFILFKIMYQMTMWKGSLVVNLQRTTTLQLLFSENKLYKPTCSAALLYSTAPVWQKSVIAVLKCRDTQYLHLHHNWANCIWDHVIQPFCLQSCYMLNVKYVPEIWNPKPVWCCWSLRTSVELMDAALMKSVVHYIPKCSIWNKDGSSDFS